MDAYQVDLYALNEKINFVKLSNKNGKPNQSLHAVFGHKPEKFQYVHISFEISACLPYIILMRDVLKISLNYCESKLLIRNTRLKR